MRYPYTMSFIEQLKLMTPREKIQHIFGRYGFWLFLLGLLLVVILMVIFFRPQPKPEHQTPIQRLAFGSDMTIEAQVQRSNGVLVCANGVLVGLDPASGNYVFSGAGVSGKWQGNLAPGVTPQQFCASPPIK